MRTVTAVGAPAVGSDDEIPSDGVNAGGGQSTTSAESLGDAAGPPLYGVIVATAVYVPHADGELSTASGPPLYRKRNSVNGTCGESGKTLVTWPVCGSTVTSPISFTRSRGSSTETKLRSFAVGVGVPK